MAIIFLPHDISVKMASIILFHALYYIPVKMAKFLVKILLDR